MLGVLANSSDECVVREFFELFKTPWEFYRGGRHYDVVLCADSEAGLDHVSAKALLVYAGGRTAFDAKHEIQIQSRVQGAEVSCGGTAIPIYGNMVRFRNANVEHLVFGGVHEARYVRVGYDLFQEVRTLLVQGQPPEYAAVPTLDLHIAFLRQLITGCGVPFVEIPPAPSGHPFIACLTHDVDHASMRRHRFDATMFGFLYRATLASVVNAARGRLSLRKLMTNWAAAAKLPLVHLGLAEDFWCRFDRYLDLEQGRPSTFFVIPFAGKPGRSPQGEAPVARGSGYDVSHIAGTIGRLKDAGCEIGLHGINAWVESDSGREEARRVTEISAKRTLGVRMHWLYRDEETPAILENAEFSYDSTVGYNQTVGYRAGTTQAYKPLRAASLLELPLHVMDTALFYPDYLNLSEEEAWERLRPVLDNSERNGGSLTINWHDRSIAPERLWGDFYVRMVDELTERGALFCTAAGAVSWFRKRRFAVFERAGVDGKISVSVPMREDDATPPLRLRFYQPTKWTVPGEREPESCREASLSDRMEFQLS